MRYFVVVAALAAISNGLAFERSDISLSKTISPRQAPPPAPGLLTYDAWFGPRTLPGLLSSHLSAGVSQWWYQDRIKTAIKVERLQSELRPGSIREKLWFGPFALPSINDKSRRPGLNLLKMDPTSIQYNMGLQGFCKNCTVLAGKATLFFENGTKAGVDSGVYIHHIVTLDGSKKNNGFPFYLCREQKGFLGTFPAPGFLVSGNDEASNMFTTPDGTFNAGFQLGPQPKIAMQAELVNYRVEPQQVFVVVEYEHVPTTATTSQVADSAVSLFSVTGCSPPDFHPTERVYNISSGNAVVPRTGFIVNAKGHLHDGGDHITLKLNGKEICTSRAIYGSVSSEAPGHSHYTESDGPAKNGSAWDVITGMTQCTDPIPVRRGDVLSMTAHVDGIKHPPRPTKSTDGHAMEADEMGVFFLNFALSNSTAEQLKLTSGKAQLTKEPAPVPPMTKEPAPESPIKKEPAPVPPMTKEPAPESPIKKEPEHVSPIKKEPEPVSPIKKEPEHVSPLSSETTPVSPVP